MENATKALMMAAGVLLGICILSVAAFLFSSMGQFSAETEAKKQDQQIAEFNSRFTKYQDAKDVTIYDIISLANFAKENNQFYELTAQDFEENAESAATHYIRVQLDTKNLETLKDEEIIDYLKSEENTQNIVYTCKDVKLSKITKRVYMISFKKTV